MKKSIVALLVITMIFSVCTMPLSGYAEDAAEEALITTTAPTEADEVVFVDTFENITDNLLHPTSTSPDKGGISSFAMYEPHNYKISALASRVGVMKSTDTTNTIQLTYLYDDNGSRNVAPYYTVQYWYDQGYDTIVLGQAIPATAVTDEEGNTTYLTTGTYSGTDDNTTGKKITGKAFDGAYLKAVDSPTGENDKVLEYNFGTSTNSNFANYTKFKGFDMRLYVGTNNAFVADKNGVADGRKLAYSWDIYVPSDCVHFFNNWGDKYTLGGIENDNGRLLADATYYDSGKLTYKVSGYALDDTERATKVSTTFEIPTDSWHKLTEVVTYDGDEYPVVSVYLDDEKIVEYASVNALKLNSSKGYYPGSISFRMAPHYNKNATGNYRVFINNAMQYFIKKLTVSGIEDSYTGFTPKNTITLNYSTPIDYDALSAAVSLTKGGEATDAAVVVEKIDDYNAKLVFSGLDVTKETAYELNIAEFADIYGQKADGKTVPITTKMAGKVSVTLSDTEVDYQPGTHKSIAITTDVKTSLSNIKFYLKNEAGEKIYEFTPSVNTDGTVLTFDLYDASLSSDSATYTFVSEGYFEEDGGDATNGDAISIPVYVVNYNFEGTYIINDDLETEGIVKDTNWLISADAIPSGWSHTWRHDDRTRGSYTLNADGVTYSYQGCATCNTTFAENYLTDAFVGVVTDPEDSSNNVIKYQAGKNGDGKHSLRIAKSATKVIDPSKNLVMSTDILLTDSLKGYMRNYGFNDLPVLMTRNYAEDRFLNAQIKTSGDDLILTGNDGFSTTLTTDEWFELKYVVMPTTTKTETKDESGTLTRVDYDTWTYMVYINDVLIQSGTKTVFSGLKNTTTKNNVVYSGGFTTTDNTGLNVYGIYTGLYPTGNGEVQPTYYIDNLKLYQPDKPVATVSFVKNVVTISFNNVLKKGSENDVIISCDGEMIEDAASNILLSSDGKSLVAELNTDRIVPATEYEISGLTDAFGQKIETIVFTTPKSYTVYVEDVEAIDTSISGKVSVPVTIKNVSDSDVQAALLVAVYDANYKMIGISVVEFDSLTTAGYNDTVAVDITGYDASDISKVKVHLWNSVAGMQAYQKAELIEVE